MRLQTDLPRKRSVRRAKVITLVEPSGKSEQHFRDKVRGLTSRNSHCMPQPEVMERVNRYVRGWVSTQLHPSL